MNKNNIQMRMRYFFTFMLSALISFGGMGQTMDALINKARSGVVSAQMELAQRYVEGDDVEQDFKQALFWYEEAAKKNSVNAMIQCGELLCQDIIQDPLTDMTPDYVKGILYLKEAEVRGNEQAKAFLKNIMAREELVEDGCPYEYLPCYDEFNRHDILTQNRNIIFEEYNKQNPVAAYYLAVLSHVEKDYDKAMEYLNQIDYILTSTGKLYPDFIASEDGDDIISSTLKIKVASLLGWCYEHGQGTVRNYEKAAHYYLVDYDYDEAGVATFPKLRGAFCYKKAGLIDKFINEANKDISIAFWGGGRETFRKVPCLQFELARMYENGDGVIKDPKKALEIYEYIVDGRNDSYSLHTLVIEPYMLNSEEVARAAYKASQMYSSGIGCKQDDDMSELYFDIALKYGDINAWRKKGI
ncbi:MAG: sel1 repeat family protein [Bacteroidales bacterium]|nr:sel1 repeat family protein [Bacteroidales bacterium]